MDRAIFDREREAIQEALAEQGQEVVIPDPDSPQYLSVFLALQRSHPNLARRLAEAEQADPAELFDPYIPRAPKVTFKHRLNTFVDKTFNRRGIDGKRVLDRQKAYKTALYTAGGLVVAGLIYSVVAPKPAPKAEQVAQEQKDSTSTDGAFVEDGAKTDAAGVKPNAAAAGTVTPPKDENVFSTASPDTPPRPITTTTPAPSEGNNTPPPPAVFNQVSPDPYTPVETRSYPTPTPKATPSYADSSGTPFGGASSAAPEPVPTPIPITSKPTPVASAAVSTTVSSPFADTSPVDTLPAPVTATPPKAEPVLPSPVISAPFGGESASAVTAPPAPTTAAPDVSAPTPSGTAMIYQRASEPQAAVASSPKTALVYQAPREAQSAAAPAVSGAANTALVYQQVSATSGTNKSSLIFQSSKAAAPANPSVQDTSSASPTVAAVAPDPDAPKFAQTSVIVGKLFSDIRTAAGMAVPAIVVSKDGNWIGTATYNVPLGRVDIRFDAYVQYKNNKSYPVQATAFQVINGRMAEGVGANIHPIAPTLAVDLARAGLNSLNVYTTALQNANTVTSNGSLITSNRTAPALVQVVRGELGKVFALPEGNQSINVVADVNGGTEIQVVYGVVNISPTDGPKGFLDGE
ncbi:hypothetical protein Dxin01_04114 [Deinococcus xinjiangensis]|uniref:Uncharacterized protein n=1 Tax=Deinococcus xinjiangensis TaxID=457454 RepID=A0ABP9VGK5_9DEIO